MCRTGTVLLNLSNLEGEETFDASALGQAEEVSEERVADDDCIFIKGCKSTRACSLLLRGPNEYMLDEMERSAAVFWTTPWTAQH